MSASSGIIAKGEKGKSKFQSLDINNLYKSTESEPTQQKGTLLRNKNGMQSLGKVPTARRPPANLPSLKAESSGNEPAVSLVPAGAAGWGSKPGEGPPPQQQQQPSVPVSNVNPAPPPAPVAVVTPVVMVPPPHEQAMHNLMPGPDKSWSAIMAREQVPNFLAHQSPQFQHEFPKLASEGGPGAAKPGDAQYGPGPSLRPQTEGSWTAGGGRPLPGAPPGPQSLGPGLHGPAGPEPGGVRTNLGPHPGVGAPLGPAGPAAIPINFPHGGGYRPLQHSFMMPPRPGTFTPPMAGMRPRYPGPGGPGGPGYPPDGRFPAGRAEGDEPVTRPIIRDEELNKMDEIARDPGWAANEDIDYNQQLAFSDNEDAVEGDSNRKDLRKDRSEKPRGKEDEKEKGEIDRRSEERGMDKRGGEWDRSGRHRGYQVGPDDDRRKPRDAEDERRKIRDAEDERRKLRDAEEERRKLREVEEERRKLREMEEERRKLREIEEERRKQRETEESRRKVREEVAVAVQVARQRKESEAKRFDESKRGDRKDSRDWDERGMKRDISDRDMKRDDHRESDEKRDSDYGKYEAKREPHVGNYDRDAKREEHGKYDREPKRDDHGKYDREANRDSDHGKYDREAKRDSDHGKYDREPKRESDHGKYDRDTKRDEHGKFEREPKREGDHSKYERDYRGRMDDRRDFRQGQRAPQYKQLPPRLQAQADRMNSQRSTGSPQPAIPPPPPASNFDQHWGHGRRYGPDSGDENRDRLTPDTYGDRYKSGPGRDTRDRFPDRHPFPDPDHRRHFDRKDRESDSERIPEDAYKKPRDVEPRKEERKEPSEEREVWRAPTRDDRDEERRPQRPDSRDSRTSRDSRNSREDKHDSDHKSRGFPAQVKVDKHREEVETKGATRHAPTPPRERPEVAEPDKKQVHSVPAPAAALGQQNDVPQVTPTPAPSDDLKEEKEDKTGAQDDSRQKGKSARGGRWGSGGPNTSTTYVRNGSRNEQRRRRVSGGNWSRPENESGSSGEGGSELEKGEKEERNRETRRSGDGTGRDGFAPSGQPSRRGRGSARVRGGTAAAPRRMDGYGPPPVKASFPQTEQPATVEEEEDRTKQKQAALNAGIAGGAARVAASQRPVAPRMLRTQSTRDPTRPKPSRGPRRSGGKGGVEGDEAWETMSNSDGEERKSEGRVRRGGGPSSRGPPPRSTAHRTQPAGVGTGSSNNRSIPPTTEGKEEKVADTGKPKPTEGEAESSQSTNSQDGRPKKVGKDGYKGGKPESGPRNSTGGPTKDRPERQDRQERPDRRGKPASQATPPVNPNPTGPQPLMSQVVNPPPTMKNYSSGGGSTWRQVPVLPPRLQKQQEQQRQHANHANHANEHDLSKMVPSMFPAKGEALQTRENAWEKPLGPPSRSPAEQGPSETSSQRSSPGGKLPSVRGDPLLDDSAPPVNTIIFENTNLKSAPGGFSAGLKQPHRVSKGSEWKPGEELFGKAELVPEPLPDHTMKPPLYRAEQAIEIDLLNAELAEMTEENAADLKHRLAGTKTLWDQNEDEPPGSAVFPAAFCQDSGMDGSGFGKAVEGVMVGMDGSGFGKTVEGVVVPDDCIMHSEVVYMSKHDPTTSSNVCKVKPQQQQAVLSTGHSPLSPPPFSSTQQGQFNYPQAGLGGSPAQFGGMPAIPSPPAGLPYSSQQMQPSGGLFTPFQLERSQFSTQFSTPYGLSAGLGGTSTFNQPPLYLPHAAPPSDLFSSMSQYRVQQHPSAHTNPNTVLLTSSANSLMSASVKPSSQSIGVIGSKGPTYQQNNQMFIPFDAMQLGVNQSYLSGSGMVQRSAPVQPAAPNFYANSPGPQAGFYNTPNSGLGQPMPSLQQPYARQGFVNQSTTHNLQSYSSQVHLEMGYRNAGAVGPASYLKSGVGNNSVTQQDVLASVFNSAPPKTRPPKQVSQPPPQHSPTQQTANKFANYPNAAQLAAQQQQQQQSANQQRQQPQANMGLQGMRSAPRYPTPIQRPMAYRGRPGPPQQRSGGKPYFEAQDGKLEEPSDLSKQEEASQLNCESKLSEPAQPGKAEAAEQDAPAVKE